MTPDPESPDASPIEGSWQFRNGIYIFVKDEFIFRASGKNVYRGNFTIDGNTIMVASFYAFKNGKWVEKFGGIAPMELSDKGIRFIGKTWVKL